MTLKSSNTTRTLQPTEVMAVNITGDYLYIPNPDAPNSYPSRFDEPVQKADLFTEHEQKPETEPLPQEHVQYQFDPNSDKLWIIKTLLDRIEALEDGLSDLKEKIRRYNIKAAHRIE